MNIDPAQIITHIIGFLLVLWLLRKYAWGSILGFVEHRRQTIVEQFDQIDREKQAVELEKQRYENELQKIEETRREKILAASRQAEQMANEIKEEARRDAVATRDKAKTDVEMEMEKANALLKERMVTAVFTATEKLLHEQLDRAKHEKLINDFLANVKVK